MTPHQETAFRDPCFRAEETAKRKFKRIAAVGSRLASVILTANIGLE